MLEDESLISTVSILEAPLEIELIRVKTQRAREMQPSLTMQLMETSWEITRSSCILLVWII